MINAKSEKRLQELRGIADRLAEQISSFKGVTGIVFMGGLTRGFMDRHSDVDIMVFLNKQDRALSRRIRKMGSDTQRLRGVDVDLEVHSIDSMRKRRWGEIYRWAFTESRIVFDRNDEVKRLLEEKLTVPDEYWLRRIVIGSEHLKWYCCPPEGESGTMAEAWIDRGDLASAHYCLTYSVDEMLRIIFALNKQFVPPPKWRLVYARRLKWLPRDCDRMLREALTVKELSKTDFDRRLKLLRGIWRDVRAKAEIVTGLTSDHLSRFYVEKILGQD